MLSYDNAPGCHGSRVKCRYRRPRMIDESTFGIGFAGTITMNFEILIVAIVSLFALSILSCRPYISTGRLLNLIGIALFLFGPLGFGFVNINGSLPTSFAILIHRACTIQVHCSPVGGN